MSEWKAVKKDVKKWARVFVLGFVLTGGIIIVAFIIYAVAGGYL